MHLTVQLLLLLPLLSIILFGAYSAAVILHGIVTFPECPQAHADLLKDIDRAHGQLTRRGFDAW